MPTRLMKVPPPKEIALGSFDCGFRTRPSLGSGLVGSKLNVEDVYAGGELVDVSGSRRAART